MALDMTDSAEMLSRPLVVGYIILHIVPQRSKVLLSLGGIGPNPPNPTEYQPSYHPFHPLMIRRSPSFPNSSPSPEKKRQRWNQSHPPNDWRSGNKENDSINHVNNENNGGTVRSSCCGGGGCASSHPSSKAPLPSQQLPPLQQPLPPAPPSSTKTRKPLQTTSTNKLRQRPATSSSKSRRQTSATAKKSPSTSSSVPTPIRTAAKNELTDIYCGERLLPPFETRDDGEETPDEQWLVSDDEAEKLRMERDIQEMKIELKEVLHALDNPSDPSNPSDANPSDANPSDANPSDPSDPYLPNNFATRVGDDTFKSKYDNLILRGLAELCRDNKSAALNAAAAMLEKDESSFHGVRKVLRKGLEIYGTNYDSQDAHSEVVEEWKQELSDAFDKASNGVYKDRLNFGDSLNPLAVVLWIVHFAPNSCKDHKDLKTYRSLFCKMDRKNPCLRMLDYILAKSLCKEGDGDWSEALQQAISEVMSMVDAKVLVTVDTDDYEAEFNTFCEKNSISMAEMDMLGLLLVAFHVKHHAMGNHDSPLTVMVSSAPAYKALFSKCDYYETDDVRFLTYIAHPQVWATKTLGNLLIYSREDLDKYSERLVCFFRAIQLAINIDFPVPRTSEIALRYAKIVDMSDEEIATLRENIRQACVRGGVNAGKKRAEAADLVHMWRSQGLIKTVEEARDLLLILYPPEYASLWYGCVLNEAKQAGMTAKLKLRAGDKLSSDEHLVMEKHYLTSLRNQIDATKKSLDAMPSSYDDTAGALYECTTCGYCTPCPRYDGELVFRNYQNKSCINPSCTRDRRTRRDKPTAKGIAKFYKLPWRLKASNDNWSFKEVMTGSEMIEHLEELKRACEEEITRLEARKDDLAAESDRPEDKTWQLEEDGDFIDSMDEKNYITTYLPKPMGIVFGENDYDGMFVNEIYDGSNAQTDGKIRPGDQLVAVGSTKVSEVGYDEAIRTIIDSPDEETKLVFFRGPAKFLNGPAGPSVEWLDEFIARGVEQGGDFIDSMDEKNYITTYLPKPMGIVFGENDYDGMFVNEIYDGSNAQTDGKIRPGDQLVAVGSTKVSEVGYDEAIRTIIDSPDEETKLVFFRGPAKFLHGQDGTN
ncbi:hypothetical protein ACHAWC_004603 [Mediolabrus comicus]